MDIDLEYTVDEALANISIGYFHYSLLVMCGIGFMMDAWEMTLLTFLAPCAGDEWDLTYQQQSAIIAYYLIGNILGTSFWGIFADRFGRKPSYISSCFMLSAAGLLSVFVHSYQLLLLTRFLTGFGIGGSCIAFDLLSELVPTHRRGSFLMYIQFFLCMGSALLTAIAWGTLQQTNWRSLTFIASVPVTITALLGIFFLPESPRWLLQKGRKHEAENVIREAAAACNQMLPPFKLSCNQAAVSENTSTFIDLFKTMYMRKICFYIGIVNLMCGFTHLGTVMLINRFYASEFIHGDTSSAVSGSNDDVESAAYYYFGDDSEVRCHFDYFYKFIGVIAETIGYTFALAILPSMGRVNSQSLFFSAAAVAVLLLGWNFRYETLLLMLALIARLTIIAATSITMVQIPELFPTKLRTVGHAFCIVVKKAGAVATAYIVTSLITSQLIGSVFLVLNAVAVLACRNLPETTDMDLDVNDDIWSPMSTVLHSGKKSESSSALNTDYAPTPATTPGVTDSNYSTFGRSIL